MMKPLRFFSVLLTAGGLALVACSSDDSPAPAASVAGTGGGAGGSGAGATTAMATVAPLMGQTVNGTATFSSTAAGVTLQLTLKSCPPGDHPFHIHEGTACTDMTSQGGHWGGMGMPDMPTRGEKITPITCMPDGTGTATTMRLSTEAANLKWTVGGDATTNVKGHVLVVHTSSMDPTRIACGVIN